MCGQLGAEARFNPAEIPNEVQPFFIFIFLQSPLPKSTTKIKFTQLRLVPQQQTNCRPIQQSIADPHELSVAFRPGYDDRPGRYLTRVNRRQFRHLRMVSALSELSTLFPRPCSTQCACPGSIDILEYSPTLSTPIKPDPQLESNFYLIIFFSRSHAPRTTSSFINPVYTPSRCNRNGFPRCFAWILRWRLGQRCWPASWTRTSQLLVCRKERWLGICQERLRHVTFRDDSIPTSLTRASWCGDWSRRAQLEWMARNGGLDGWTASSRYLTRFIVSKLETPECTRLNFGPSLPLAILHLHFYDLCFSLILFRASCMLGRWLGVNWIFQALWSCLAIVCLPYISFTASCGNTLNTRWDYPNAFLISSWGLYLGKPNCSQ